MVLFIILKTDTRRGFEHENPTLRNPVLGTGTGVAAHTGRFALQTERSKAADKNHVTLEAVVENTPEQVRVISKFGYGDTFLHPVLLHLEMLLKLCSIIKNQSRLFWVNTGGLSNMGGGSRCVRTYIRSTLASEASRPSKGPALHGAPCRAASPI